MIDRYREMKFSHSYNLAGFLREKVFKNNKEDYLSDYFDVFDDDFQLKMLKPDKITILHNYIKNELELELEYLASKGDPDTLSEEWEELLNDYNVKYLKSDINQDYIEYLEDKINENLVEKIADETFQLLFSDRMFCLKFNSIIAENVKPLEVGDLPNLLEKDGKVIRCTYFPVWVQRAVFLRDKGCCSVCLNDLSGLLKTDFDDAIDHIVPLNLGGINDVSNFQLICRKCNLEKSGHTIRTSELYPTYF